MKLKLFLLTFVLVLCTSSAFAWPACTGQWNQVPKGTSHANGSIYITGDNLTFQCTQPQPPTPPSTNNSNTNQNTNTAKSDAKSSSASNAVAKQDQKQNQSQTQSSDSAAVAAASDIGNGSNNSVSNITYKQVHQVASALAPETLATAPCQGTLGGAVQTGVLGAAFGGSKTNENCEILENARFYGFAGSRVAMCKLAITTKASKKAGVTLEDCLGPAPIVVPVAEVVPAPVVPVAVVPETPAVIDPSNKLSQRCGL